MNQGKHKANPYAHTWAEAEASLRAEIARLVGVDHAIRHGITGLHWQGGAYQSFVRRTHNRHEELHLALAVLRPLLGYVQLAATEKPA